MHVRPCDDSNNNEYIRRHVDCRVEDDDLKLNLYLGDTSRNLNLEINLQMTNDISFSKNSRLLKSSSHSYTRF